MKLRSNNQNPPLYCFFVSDVMFKTQSNGANGVQYIDVKGKLKASLYILNFVDNVVNSLFIFVFQR